MTDAAGFRGDVGRVPEFLFALASVLEGEAMWPLLDTPRRWWQSD